MSITKAIFNTGKSGSGFAFPTAYEICHMTRCQYCILTDQWIQHVLVCRLRFPKAYTVHGSLRHRSTGRAGNMQTYNRHTLI